MSNTNRYCPNCGNKTDQTHCEICGRLTNPLDDKIYQGQTIYANDIDGKHSNSHSDYFKDIKEDVKRNQKKITVKKPVAKPVHPYNTSSSNAGKTAAKRGHVLSKIIFILVFFMIFFNVGIVIIELINDCFIEREHEGYSSALIDEIGDHLMYVDHADADVTCRIVNQDEESYLMVENLSSYYVSGDVYYDDDLLYEYLPFVEPYTQVFMENDDNAKTCTFEQSDTATQSYAAAPVPYLLRYFDDDIYEESVWVEENTKSESLRELARYLIVSSIINGRTDIDTIYFYRDEELIQTAFVNYDKDYIYFIEEDGEPELEDISLMEE